MNTKYKIGLLSACIGALMFSNDVKAQQPKAALYGVTESSSAVPSVKYKKPNMFGPLQLGTLLKADTVTTPMTIGGIYTFSPANGYNQKTAQTSIPYDKWIEGYLISEFDEFLYDEISNYNLKAGSFSVYVIPPNGLSIDLLENPSTSYFDVDLVTIPSLDLLSTVNTDLNFDPTRKTTKTNINAIKLTIKDVSVATFNNAMENSSLWKAGFPRFRLKANKGYDGAQVSIMTLLVPGTNITYGPNDVEIYSWSTDLGEQKYGLQETVDSTSSKLFLTGIYGEANALYVLNPPRIVNDVFTGYIGQEVKGDISLNDQFAPEYSPRNQSNGIKKSGYGIIDTSGNNRFSLRIGNRQGDAYNSAYPTSEFGNISRSFNVNTRSGMSVNETDIKYVSGPTGAKFDFSTDADGKISFKADMAGKYLIKVPIYDVTFVNAALSVFDDTYMLTTRMQALLGSGINQSIGEGTGDNGAYSVWGSNIVEFNIVDPKTTNGAIASNDYYNIGTGATYSLNVLENDSVKNNTIIPVIKSVTKVGNTVSYTSADPVEFKVDANGNIVAVVKDIVLPATGDPRAALAAIGIYEVEYEICDGSNCQTAIAYVNVEQSNNGSRLLANTDVAYTTEGHAVSGNVVANDTYAGQSSENAGGGDSYNGIRVPNPVLTVTAKTEVVPGVGELVLNQDGTYTFTPADGFYGSYDFSYVLTNANDPNIHPEYRQTREGVLNIYVAPHNPQPDNVVLTSSATGPANSGTGNLNKNDNVLNESTYGPGTPVAVPSSSNEPGSSAPVVTVAADGTYTTTGGTPGVYTYYVEVTAPNGVTKQTVPLQITVLEEGTQIQNPPVANPDYAEVVGKFGTATARTVTMDLLNNDKAGNTETANLSVNTTPTVAPTKGSVTIDAQGVATYTPTTAGFVGVDSFQYEVCDNLPNFNSCSKTWAYVNVLAGADNSGSIVSSIPPTLLAKDDNTVVALGGQVSGNVLTNDKHMSDGGIVDANNTDLSVVPFTSTPIIGVTVDVAADGSYTVTSSGTGQPGTVIVPVTVKHTDGTTSTSNLIIAILPPTNLPITLANFDAKIYGVDDAILNWQTYKEDNNAGFDVEQSTDAKQWKSIGYVKSQAENGNSNDLLSYSLLDYNAKLGSNFYRLKIVSKNGEVTYSPIRQVWIQDNFVLNIHPNPTSGALNIRTTSIEKIKGIQIVDFTGKSVKQYEGYQQQIALDGLSNGNYIIKFILEDGSSKQIKFTIAK